MTILTDCLVNPTPPGMSKNSILEVETPPSRLSCKKLEKDDHMSLGGKTKGHDNHDHSLSEDFSVCIEWGLGGRHRGVVSGLT